MNEELLRKRVSAGAKLLDRVRPGWAKQIDLALLDIGSIEDCVLAQVFGDYFDGKSLATGCENCHSMQSLLVAAEYGFTLELIDFDCRILAYSILQNQWILEIKERTNAA